MFPVLAIDIGSTKICALVADSKGEELHIAGVGIAKAAGLKKGSIVNIDLASKSIKSAVDEAIRMAGSILKSAYVSVSGAYTKGIDSFGIVNIPNREITVKEVNRAMQTALYNATVPSDFEVLHALPYDFKIDEQDCIQDPVGMSGNRMEVKVHIVSIQKSTLDNLKKTVTLAGLDIRNVVLSGYATSIAVLNDDERDLGVCVIDMGGSTCDTVFHIGNSIRVHEFLGVGGSHITGDLSMALHTPLSVAEKVKNEYGSLNPSQEAIIELPIIGNENQTQEVSLEVVSNVIYARVEETLLILAKQIQKSGFKNQLGAGVVLTGGMTKIEGLHELAAPLFDNMPVRIAKPKNLEGLFDSLKDPAFSTVVGLVLYAVGEHTLYEIDSNKKLLAKDVKLNAPKKAPIVEDELAKQEYDETNLQNLQNQTKENNNIADIMVDKDGDEDAPNAVKKLWRWATQIF